MAEKYIRLGSLEDFHFYDDAEDYEEPAYVGGPAVRQQSILTDGAIVACSNPGEAGHPLGGASPAVVMDDVIVHGVLTYPGRPKCGIIEVPEGAVSADIDFIPDPGHFDGEGDILGVHFGPVATDFPAGYGVVALVTPGWSTNIYIPLSPTVSGFHVDFEVAAPLYGSILSWAAFGVEP